jgi:hypothetical protein
MAAIAAAIEARRLRLAFDLIAVDLFLAVVFMAVLHGLTTTWCGRADVAADATCPGSVTASCEEDVMAR